MISKIIPWIIFSLFGFYLVGNNFSAKQGMIDDHEIALFLGQDGKVKLAEFVPTLLSTEVGQWGSYLRYRPSYYTLRVLETALWRDNATLWYFSRYIMLVVSLWLGWKLVSLYFPKILAYLFVFYVMTLPFWPDILTRLGPSEIYSVPALLLFVYGLTQNKLWMITLGYIVSVGSKENFLVLFPVLMLWIASRIYLKKFTRRDLVTSLIMGGYTLLIVSGIFVATANSGADIYGAQISYPERFKLLYSYKRYIVESRHLQLPILIMLVGIVKIIRDIYLGGVAKLKNNSILNHLIIGGILGVAIASQYIFYNSQIPSNMRYDFPVMILFPAFFLVAMSLARSLLAKLKFAKLGSVVIYLAIIITCSSYVIQRGYILIHAKSTEIVAMTQEFQNKLEIVENIIKANPQAKLIYVAEKYIEFEPIVSVSRFLNSRNITNDFMLYYTSENDTDDPMELDTRLIKVMNGELGKDGIFDRFTPYKVESEPCYSITFGEVATLDTCPEIANF